MRSSYVLNKMNQDNGTKSKSKRGLRSISPISAAKTKFHIVFSPFLKRLQSRLRESNPLSRGYEPHMIFRFTLPQKYFVAQICEDLWDKRPDLNRQPLASKANALPIGLR